MSRAAPQFEDIHEELIGNYLEARPSADYQEASDETADAAHAAWVEAVAVATDAMSDAAKDRAIEDGFED